MKRNIQQWLTILCGTSAILIAGCASMEAPATADVAVSKSAVENASNAGASEFAPIEMNSAREKLAKANKAMADKNYKEASEWATQANADAKLAQSKVNSAKTQATADALQQDIRILREELNRANK